MDRAMRMVLAGGITLLVSGIAFMGYLVYLRNNPPTPPGTPTPPPRLEIPPFSLVDQEGAARNRSMLEGHVSVVWFMFTRCPIYCPAMSVQMADLQRKLKGSGVQFVAISLDPAHDTPAVLKAYGTERYGVDWSNWAYLTEPAGKPVLRTGWNIYTRDLHQVADETPETTPGQGTVIDHMLNFFLVGPDGNVLEDGWFHSNRAEEMKALRERALGAMKYYGDKGQLKQ